MRKSLKLMTLLLLIGAAVIIGACTPDEEDEQSFIVTFNVGAGTLVSQPTATVTRGETITQPVAVKNDHQLIGWFDDLEFSEQWDFESSTVEADLELFAQWRLIEEEPIKMILVTFDTAGGSEVSAINVVYGQRVERPVNPTRENYIFNVWMILDEDGQKIEFDFDTPIYAEVTLIASWEEWRQLVYFTLEFDSMGGSDVSFITISENDVLPELPTPTKDGFIFGGWYLTDSFDHRFEDNNLTQDLRIFARWITIIENVTINGAQITWDWINGVYTFTIRYRFNNEHFETTVKSNSYVITHGVGIVSDVIVTGGTHANAHESLDEFEPFIINELSVLSAAFDNMQNYRGVEIRSFGQSTGTPAGTLTVGGLTVLNRDEQLLPHEIFRYSFSRANSNNSLTGSNAATVILRQFYTSGSDVLHQRRVAGGAFGFSDQRNTTINANLVPTWPTTAVINTNRENFEERFLRDPFTTFLYTVNPETLTSIPQALNYENGEFTFQLELDATNGSVLNRPEASFIADINITGYNSINLTFRIDSNMRLLEFNSDTSYDASAPVIGSVTTNVNSNFTFFYSHTPIEEFIFIHNDNAINLTWRG